MRPPAASDPPDISYRLTQPVTTRAQRAHEFLIGWTVSGQKTSTPNDLLIFRIQLLAIITEPVAAEPARSSSGGIARPGAHVMLLW